MTKTSSKMKYLVGVPLCALFFIIGAVTAQAATYHVAQTGNDTNSCAAAGNIATPKKTFKSAVTCMTPGDTLYIRAGTWTEQLDIRARSGTAGAPLTYAGYPGERPCLTGKSGQGSFAIYGPYDPPNNYITIANLLLDGTCDGTAIGSLPDGGGWSIGNTNGAPPHDILIDNVEIRNWKYSGIFLAQGTANVTIQNSKIHDMKTTYVGNACSDTLANSEGRWYGIYAHDTVNLVVQNNEIHNNPGGGLQIYPGPNTGTIIRNNSIHDNNMCTNAVFGGLVVQNNITNLLFYNNIVYNNGSDARSGNAFGIQLAFNAVGSKVWNNTFYGNKHAGIDIIDGSVTGSVVQNNIVYNNNGGGTQIHDGGAGSTVNHNLITNPSFVNAAGESFDLQASSPAIDAGVILSTITTDIKSTPRPKGLTYDIGAYEMSTTSDTLPPLAPRGLSVN